MIWRMIPSAGNRRALLERGDADISFDLPPKDVAELATEKQAHSDRHADRERDPYIGMNVTEPPFDNVKVRQAVAYAMPYQQIMDAAMFGRGIPMFGGPTEVTAAGWPQPTPTRPISPRRSAIARSRLSGRVRDHALVRSRFRHDQRAVMHPGAGEPRADRRSKPRSTRFRAPTGGPSSRKRALPLIANAFGGWLNYPEYFFFWAYHGQNAIFNTMSYQNPAMDKLIDAARFETDPQEYKEEVEGFIGIAFDEVPRIPLFQPMLTWRCRRTSPATATGSTASSTTASWQDVTARRQGGEIDMRSNRLGAFALRAGGPGWAMAVISVRHCRRVTQRASARHCCGDRGSAPRNHRRLPAPKTCRGDHPDDRHLHAAVD